MQAQRDAWRMEGKGVGTEGGHLPAGGRREARVCNVAARMIPGFVEL